MPEITPFPRIETLDLATISLADAVGIASLDNVIWPHPEASPEAAGRRTIEAQSAGQYKPGEHLWFAVRDGERIIASAQTFPRPITVGGKAVTVLALAGVCTLAEYRGHGLGSALVSAAFEQVRGYKFPFAFFQTTRRNRPFYERLGSGMIPGDTVIINSLDPGAGGRSPFWDDIAMYFPASRPWPAGPIDTLGPGW